jgi:ribosomal subunit interface protein
MDIQFNTGSNIEGSDRLSDYFSSVINDSLKRFENQITRVEVHLSEEGSSTNDKKCTLEARLKNLNPIAVTNYGNSHEEAIKGSIEKLKKSIDTTTGRLSNH